MIHVEHWFRPILKGKKFLGELLSSWLPKKGLPSLGRLRARLCHIEVMMNILGTIGGVGVFHFLAGTPREVEMAAL